ncbi:MAG: leucine-rich repeat domain-containing protein [Bacteroidales bacterium]|nr:leucine-rich repeat domain-containing protein [Bacteroidales bacterium]
MTLDQILAIPTAPSKEELASDVWDDENGLCYSADGRRVLDAENFASEVTVAEGCAVICDEVFAFQDYMAERNIGEEIPLEERSSFLEKIHLPSTLTHIGAGAFGECGELLSIKLPASLLYIGPSAFIDCWQLEKLSIPSQTRYIGAGAFQGCINLYQIRLGKSLEYIGEDAFDDCESLETILVPRGCKERYKGWIPAKLHKRIQEI